MRKTQMKKYLFFTVLAGFLFTSTNIWAFSLELQSEHIQSNSYQTAEAIFLPDYQEKDLTFEAPDSFYPEFGNCNGYNYTKENCSAPRTLSTPCPTDSTKYKYCQCDPSIFKYDSKSCSYQATSPYFPNDNRLLGGNLCQDSSSSQLVASECNCKYFRYTNDASCADPEKIIDERSSCRENNGQIRYENCKCNPKLYPFSFIGKLRSQAFLDEVAKHCGNENNFLICQNYSEEIAFKCAVDTAYKYDSYSCRTENPAYEVSGDYIKFFNGHGNEITLYKNCDCPTTYSSDCNGSYGSQFYGKDGKTVECRRKTPLCKMGFYQGLSDKGMTNCYDNVHGSVVKVAETCVKRDGSKVFRCECAGRGNWGYSGAFCGTCVQNTDHIVCIDNGKEISNSCLNKL